MPIFALKTTLGQEKTVVRLIAQKAQTLKIPVLALLTTDSLNGYIFLEATSQETAEESVQNLRHVSSRVVQNKAMRSIPVSELEGYLIPKPAIEGLSDGDIIEVIAGPFKGVKAKIIRVDASREEVTVALLDGGDIPITLNADYVKAIIREEEEEDIFSF